MSVPDLPDDMTDWPTDPFDLLGVTPGASDADIKRAYTRLLRRFKPEHHPDQFRRIREAYEACQERVAWYRPDSVEVSPPPPPPPRRVPQAPPASREPVVDRPVTPAPDREPVVDPAINPAPPLDPIEELWEAAVAGNEPEAYAGLVRICEESPDDATLPLRLYWLLTLTPTLDTHRTRHHWLADALARSKLRGPAVELYRRELETDPEGALDDAFEPGPYFEALTAGGSAAALLGVARWRVSAAGRLGWIGRMRADLSALRDSLVMDDEAGWLGLLVLAAAWVAWADSVETTHYISGEIAQLSHLQLSQSSLFDRMEEVEQVVKDVEWGRFAQLPPALLALTKISFSDPGYARPTEVEAAATALNDWGDDVLTELDSTFTKRPIYLGLLAREFTHYLQSRGETDSVEIPTDRLRGLARRLGVQRAVSYVGRMRADILRLLQEHAVHPDELAAALAHDPDEMYRPFAPQLHEDLAMQVAWLASRVVTG